MKLDDYKMADWHKGEGYLNFVTLVYESTGKFGIPLQYPLCVKFEYNPKTRNWKGTIGEDSSETYQLFSPEEYQNAPSFAQKLFLRELEKQQSIYDKMYLFLQREQVKIASVKLHIIKHYRHLSADVQCVGSEYGIIFRINFDKMLDSFYLYPVANRAGGSEFPNVKDYPSVQGAFRYLVEESSYRLKILMAECG